MLQGRKGLHSIARGAARHYRGRMAARGTKPREGDVTKGVLAPIETGARAGTAVGAVTSDLRERLDAAMAKLALGDRAQFSYVFSELWPLVSRSCSAWLNDADDGEDAAQRALITLMSRAHEYRAGESALAWALTLGAWECRTIRRRRQRSRLEPLAQAEDQASSGPSPEAQSSTRELGRMATALLVELTVDERVMVEAALLDDGPTDGPVPSVVRKRKQRAFERLRGLWRRIHGD